MNKWEGNEKSGEKADITQYLSQCNFSVQVVFPTPFPLFLAINLMSLHMLQILHQNYLNSGNSVNPSVSGVNAAKCSNFLFFII